MLSLLFDNWNTNKDKMASLSIWLEFVLIVENSAVHQGSDTRVHTQKTHRVDPPKKNPPVKPTKKTHLN